MKLQRFAFALAGAGLFAATAVSGSAVAADPKPSPAVKLAKSKVAAAKSSAAELCYSWAGWVDPAGALQSAEIYPGKPPTSAPSLGFKFVGVRASGTWYGAFDASDRLYFYGLFLQGGNLYRHATTVSDAGVITPKATKVGSGWTSFKTIATSNYSIAQPRHTHLYALNANGSLYRYSQVGTAFRALGSFPGFKSFKAMTVISETATYDTLLMTTTAGAIYTVRIPVAATAKPALKLIRSTGFAPYEALTAHTCGTRGGSLILGIDHDTDSAFQYAFSKANGAATAITAYGKAPDVFNGTTTAPFTTHYDQLVGE
ncbi:hypothetical protein [Kribbella sp. CA-293567]|uniref:hypothetical protein n=1 Tax=Kribbella sp. CA-293567 TaxID=3002436 RepID=UPI0022DD5B82|nr:hypothetical protein [Kribbella sp. CA-293567]WBQ06442.1 hypothetical protein OX958_06535 [Kribbella sp. CA-293567]